MSEKSSNPFDARSFGSLRNELEAVQRSGNEYCMYRAINALHGLELVKRCLTPTQSYLFEVAGQNERCPALPSAFSNFLNSPQGYWILHAIMGGGMQWFPHEGRCRAALIKEAMRLIG